MRRVSARWRKMPESHWAEFGQSSRVPSSSETARHPAPRIKALYRTRTDDPFLTIEAPANEHNAVERVRTAQPCPLAASPWDEMAVLGSAKTFRVGAVWAPRPLPSLAGSCPSRRPADSSPSQIPDRCAKGRGSKAAYASRTGLVNAHPLASPHSPASCSGSTPNPNHGGLERVRREC